MSLLAQELFSQIRCTMLPLLTSEFIKSTKTKKGDTQKSERVIIAKIKEILDGMSLLYTEAGSQQPNDFRNVGGIGLNIEIKKTDNETIIFNDSCPSADIFYIIIFTGKEYIRTIDKNIPPQVVFVNGEEFLKDASWLPVFIYKINALKDEYARGENKKLLPGIMSVYPRPTFKAAISQFLHN